MTHDLELTPTLWRTCRVLANQRRLALVEALIDQPPQPVAAVAAACGQSEAICSHGLRQLQARGLCRATRSGRWVSYTLAADPCVTHSESLLRALTRALRASRSDFKPLIATLTAYTHPRRIDIVATLHRAGPCATDDLGRHCGISPAALYRHLKKLERRGVLRQADGSVFLLTTADALSRALCEIVCCSADATARVA